MRKSPLATLGATIGAIGLIAALAGVTPAAHAASTSPSKPAPAPSTWDQPRPTWATTGITPKLRGKLTPHYGDYVVTRPGAVVEGLDIHGFIEVQAPNVTIRNVRVRGRSDVGPGNRGLITNYGWDNLTIENALLKPDVPTVWLDGIKGWDFSAHRVNIINTVDSIKIHGDNVRVTSSLLRRTSYFANDPNQGGGETHNDNVQILEGDDVTIRGNVIRGSTNFAVLAAPEKGTVTNLVVSDNWVDGGHCTMKFAHKGGHWMDATVRYNVFGPNRAVANCPLGVTTRVPQFDEAANVWGATGKPIAILNLQS